MQGTELAGVELISAIFHYQYQEKKKDQANGNQTIQNQPIVCLESQIKTNAVSVLSFVFLWHFSFLMTWNLTKARPFGPTPREKTTDAQVKHTSLLLASKGRALASASSTPRPCDDIGQAKEGTQILFWPRGRSSKCYAKDQEWNICKGLIKE